MFRLEYPDPRSPLVARKPIDILSIKLTLLTLFKLDHQTSKSCLDGRLLFDRRLGQRELKDHMVGR